MGAETTTDWAAAAAGVLAWWEAAGVDTLVDDAPRDWFARPALPKATATPAKAAPAASPAALPATLEAFLTWRLGPEAPDANWGPARLSFAGDPAAPLLVLTDMPEDEDSRDGTLLSGPAGRLFDAMLGAIGLVRAGIHLGALAISRPASGQLPAEALPELARLARHVIALTRPHAVLLLGNASSRALLGEDASRARGRLLSVDHDGGTTTATVLMPPRFLLGQPARKADAWADLLLLKGNLPQ